MLIFQKEADLKRHLQMVRDDGKTLGFVPTMGALHKGHLALIDATITQGDYVICSIFVNPVQFNDASDLAYYPRPVEEDIAMLEQAGCDVLLMPSVEEVYPDGLKVGKYYDLGYLETLLEGASRPGHFQGVARVVDRLLDMVQPDNMYIGQKDYQQCMVLKELVKLTGRKVTLHIVATTREADGLAMSSRNRRLTESQRAIAGLVYQCLVSIQAKKGIQDFAIVEKECRELLEQKGLRVDYIQLADAEDLTLLKQYDDHRKVVCLMAVFVGDIRLIDNLIL